MQLDIVDVMLTDNFTLVKAILTMVAMSCCFSLSVALNLNTSCYLAVVVVCIYTVNV